jgi:hypothetical protein
MGEYKTRDGQDQGEKGYPRQGGQKGASEVKGNLPVWI